MMRILRSASLWALSLLLACSGGLPSRVAAGDLVEPPYFADAVAAGTLPPLSQRLPQQPAVVDLAALGKLPGRYGGELWPAATGLGLGLVEARHPCEGDCRDERLPG